ncbi:Y-family DNA polymerase [Brevundimonas sp. NPDC092305]|uniref:Y-family DNA polymerase n=1 Tax=Brevundimonas sp. NPDC092305 TaxID=3363957 RepID=UPI0037F3C1E7
MGQASDRVFALSDGNSFYCSCERVFEPALEGRALIVLSNNDGCAIARTPEAKALGIRMGDPWFRVRDRATAAGVVARSSNYALYGDMSRRVNDVYRTFAPDVEIYSIDESFLDFSDAARPAALAREMRATVRRWTGIPTCVGLGPTRTLAKVANHIAKRFPDLGGVCDLTDPATRGGWLARVGVADVWGVGPASTTRLRAQGIETADQLAALDPRAVRPLLTVVGERLVRELNGVLCADLETTPPRRKGMAVTRSFGRPVTDLAEMQEAVAAYATRVGEKLRRHGLLTRRLTVFFHTSPFADGPARSVSGLATLREPTSDTLELVQAAVGAVRRLWRPGFRYAKAGIVLDELVPPEGAPRALIEPADPRREALMAALDHVNGRFGRGALAPARAGLRRAWALKAEMRSPAYTTRLPDIPVLRC